VIHVRTEAVCEGKKPHRRLLKTKLDRREISPLRSRSGMSFIQKVHPLASSPFYTAVVTATLARKAVR
jgi:hypothetical protein